MALEEAIDNFEREIVEFEEFKKIRAVTHEDYAKIERTRQLAEWLKELQTYRNRECETCKYSEDGKCAGTEKCHECMWQNQYEQEPCDDVITFKEDVLDTISRIGLLKSDTKEVQAVAECLRAVEALAPVAPQPKTGHWIDNHNGTISCSYCHTWFHKDDRYSYMRHCPDCGAKVQEEEV